MGLIKERATFVIPNYSSDDENCLFFLEQTIKSILIQSDKNWQMVIVDDNSPNKKAIVYLKQMEEQYPGKINLILKDKNEGAGICRNIGVKWAYENKSPIVLFSDADDISHQRRLEKVREIFSEREEASVVYSTFNVIDEHNNVLDDEKVVPSIMEIIEQHRQGPPQGKNVWIDIGTKTGYINLTSSTAVRTELAYKYPFPATKYAEDSHTWMRYSAAGAEFVYCPDIPSLYRTPLYTQGSSARTNLGGPHVFFQNVAEVLESGFKEALSISLKAGNVFASDENMLLVKFFLKLAEHVAHEEQYDLAKQVLQKAETISYEMTRMYKKDYKYIEKL